MSEDSQHEAQVELTKPTAPKSNRSLVGGPFLLILLVCLVSVAGNFWQLWQGRALATEWASERKLLEARRDGIESDNKRLQSRVAQLETQTVTRPLSLVAAKCRTVYEYYCFERDKDNRCTVWERQSREVCDGKDDGFNSNPRECFACYEWNKDGSCKKTRKVDC